MSTGVAHPLAIKPVICHIQVEPDPQLSYTIQISAEYFGILFFSVEDGQNELIIWEWKTGVIETVSKQQHCLKYCRVKILGNIVRLWLVTKFDPSPF